MHKLLVNAWERVQLLGVVGGQRGPVDFIARCLELRSILSLSETEKERIDYIELPDGSARWMDVEHEFTLNFEESQWQLLNRLVHGYQGWPVSELVQPLIEKFPKE